MKVFQILHRRPSVLYGVFFDFLLYVLNVLLCVAVFDFALPEGNVKQTYDCAYAVGNVQQRKNKRKSQKLRLNIFHGEAAHRVYKVKHSVQRKENVKHHRLTEKRQNRAYNYCDYKQKRREVEV
jgi:hypothetical protein